jgi:hypothetical protein
MNSGGYIEQYEIEIDAGADNESELLNSEIKRISDSKEEMARSSGRDFQISRKMKQLIQDAGFVDVHEQKVKLPLGPWASDPKLKDIGRFFERFYKSGLQGWLMKIYTLYMGVSQRAIRCRFAEADNHRRKHQRKSMLRAPEPFKKSTSEKHTSTSHCKCPRLRQLEKVLLC